MSQIGPEFGEGDSKQVETVFKKKSKKTSKIPSKLELLRKLPNVKRNWSSETELGKFYQMYGIGKAPADLLQLPVFQEKVDNVHWFAYFFLFYTGILSASVLYTLIYHLYGGDFERALPCTCPTGIACVGGMPLFVILLTKQRFKLKSLVDFGARYIYRDDREDVEYNRICSKHLDPAIRSYIIKVLLMFLSAWSGIIGPIHAYFTYGARATTTDFRVPFAEDRSDIDFMVNIWMTAIFAVHGGLVYFCVKMFMTIFANIVAVIPDLIYYELNRLADEWQEKTISKLEMTLRITNIVKKI